ncbi:hypothetical protein BC828DRAFT_396217 [Blastocladiella britannica]|nr:hypothetical protein BC828DRAFT_396217 [Blastocladiella britannica]
MGNCLGRTDSHPPAKAQRLGGRDVPAPAPSTAPIAMTPLSSPPPPPSPPAAIPATKTTTPADAAAMRQARAEAAERRAAQEKSRGVQGSGGAIAARLEQERQLSDRDLLRAREAGTTSTTGLSWVVDA